MLSSPHSTFEQASGVHGHGDLAVGGPWRAKRPPTAVVNIRWKTRIPWIGGDRIVQVRPIEGFNTDNAISLWLLLWKVLGQLTFQKRALRTTFLPALLR